MNKYIIPICDVQSGEVWNEVISATSFKDCEEKIIKNLVEFYNELDLDDTLPYNKFITKLDSLDILVGNIKDIEEL